MARIIHRDAKGPKEIDGKWYCMCGLSKNQPFCDGSHQKTADEEEGKVYKYENGSRTEVNI